MTKEDAKRAIDLLMYFLEKVGYDQESNTFYIDRFGSKISHSQRSKVFVVRDAINNLKEKIGEIIPFEEIEKELKDKLTTDEIEDSIKELIKSSQIFQPRPGYYQKL